MKAWLVSSQTFSYLFNVFVASVLQHSSQNIALHNESRQQVKKFIQAKPQYEEKIATEKERNIASEKC